MPIAAWPLLSTKWLDLEKNFQYTYKISVIEKELPIWPSFLEKANSRINFLISTKSLCFFSRVIIEISKPIWNVFLKYALVILEDQAINLFENVSYSPYILITNEIKNKKNIDLLNKSNGLNITKSDYPVITHFDYSSRLQTINKSNRRIFKLVSKFFKETGCPMLINTSFNVRGKPIILSPKDAIDCFFGTNMDVLVIENYLIYKYENEKKINTDFITDFLKD